MQRVRDGVQSIVSRLTPASRVQGSQRLSLAISLPLRNQPELEGLLRQLYSPSSPDFRKFLDASQFAERFAPSKEDYQALIAFARANDLTITGRHPNRMILDVEGSVSNIEKVFHIQIQNYHHPKEQREFYAPNTDPSVDLPIMIKGISGLDDYSLPHPSLKVNSANGKVNTKGNAGSGRNGTYAGNDFRAAYAPGVSLNGIGQTIGLVEFDGYAGADITYYENQFGLPNVKLINVLLDRFNGAPTGNGGEVEVCLDIEVAIAMAPGISNLIVYEAGPAGKWHDILNRVATDNLVKQISCSWYSPNAPADPVADQIFQQMAAQGQSFFAASGDSDAYTGLIPFPCDSPYVTQVGGSTLSTSGPGGTWVSETAWNWGIAGSGGGVSTQYAIPYWQQGIDMSGNQGSMAMRNVPDVALIADNVYVRVNGLDENVGGTSCAAPLWAGFLALANQQATTIGQSIGFLNPSLYQIGKGAGYASIFHDTATGNNFSFRSPAKFSAVNGYDLCTGLGTPAGQLLINALAGPPDSLQVPSFIFNATGGVGGPFVPESAAYTLTNLGSDPVTWSASVAQSWLALSATGGTLAVGGSTTVIASLNPAANGLGQGEYSNALVFADTNTGVVQTRPATLNVKAPRPAITSPLAVEGLLGSGFRYQIVASNGPTSYSAAGLPAGLRVNTSTGLIAGTPAVSGTFAVSLNATNPTGTGTASLSLTILSPVTTQAATGISTNLATVRGTVNPDGFATTVRFEYGTSPALEGALSTSGTLIGSGTRAVAVTGVASGLLPSTKYYFRVNASNTGGGRTGSILSFTTTAVPLLPTILPGHIQSVSDFGASMNALINPRGAATTVHFDFGLTTGYGSSTVPQDIGSGSSGVYAGSSLTGLASGTLYHYRVVSVSALGTFYGPDQEFTTQVETGLFVVASKNDNVPGIANARFSRFGSPITNDLGHSAFQAIVTAIPGIDSSVTPANNSGIWAELGSTQSGLIVRTGDPAPGIPGGIFASLSDPVFNDNDVIAFYGTVKTGAGGIVAANSGGIWAVTNGTPSLVTRARSQAPGCPQGALFASFPKIVLPNQGGVAILGNLVMGNGSASDDGGVVRSNNQGIWAVDTGGQLRLIVRKGDTQQINGTPKIISSLSIFDTTRFSGQSRSFNGPGDLIFRVVFTDGSQTVEKVIFP